MLYMPLLSGKETLKSSLMSMYSDVAGLKSVDIFAKKKSQAIASFVVTGIPMTVLINLPGGVVGSMTSGPVLASGIGGFDKPVPGMGLSSAKSILETDLVALWTHGGANVSAAVYSDKFSLAVFKYFSEAIILTLDTSNSPLPAPPPAGPVTGPMIGLGGTLTNAPGIGYGAALPTLESALKASFGAVGSEIAIAKKAKDVTEAIHNFCIQGIVNTTGVIIAPAAVAPPPAPPNGAYFPGTGSAAGAVS